MNAINLTSIIDLAQIPVVSDDIIITPSFFITILAGVILALAFQFILTAISVAAGITAIGDVKKNYVKSKVEPSDNTDRADYEFDQDYSSGTSMGVKITSAFGIWSVITTCIALFGATALALNLNVIESDIINTTTALVIWALFFLILFYLEAKVARTLIGNLISAATSGLRSSANMLSSFFTPSPETKIETVVGNTIARIRKEFDSGLNADKLSEVLDKFLTRVDNKIPDYEDLKSDMENIAKKSSNKNTAGKWMAIQQILTKAISENSSSKDPERKGKAEKLQEILNTVTSSYNASPGKVEGIKNIIEEFTPLERQEIEEKIENAKSYLKGATIDNLSTGNLETRLKELLNDPKLVTSIIADNFNQLNREKIIALLNDNTNLKKEDLDSYANQIESAVQKVTKEFDKENEDRIVKRFENKVANFFDTTGREELNYDLLKNDVKHIMDNPNDSLEVIKERFSTFDNATLRAVVTNNRYIKEEHIDKVLETIDTGKNEVMDKISQIQTKANQQVEIAKRKAVIQAEHARATAASAAWWLVITSILSAVAAIGGGFVAL